MDSALTRFAPSLPADQVGWSAWSDTPATGRVFHPVSLLGSKPSSELEVSVRPTISAAYLYYSVTDQVGNVIGKTVTLRESSGAGVSRNLLVSPGELASLTVTVTAAGTNGRTQVAVIKIQQEAP